MKLMPETLKRHRERRCKKPCEKADCRRKPQHDPRQLELPLENADE